jgi:hypothetical protein
MLVGDPTCPHNVVTAKRLKRDIENSMDGEKEEEVS